VAQVLPSPSNGPDRPAAEREGGALRQLRRGLGAALRVCEGEWSALVVTAVLYFLVAGGGVIGTDVVNSLFVKRLGVERLPYAYLVGTLFVVLASGAFGRLTRGARVKRLMVCSFVLFGATLLGLRILVSLSPRAIYAAYVLTQVITLLTVAEFWMLAHEAFHIRQMKRLMGMVSAGGSLGAVTMGLSIRPLAARLGTPNLLLVWAGLLGLGIPLALLMTTGRRAEPEVRRRPRVKSPEGAVARVRPGLRAIGSSRLLQSLVWAAVMAGTVRWLVDFQFNRVAGARFASDRELAAFFGHMSAIVGGAALMFQVFLLPRLVVRFGLPHVFLAQPAMLLCVCLPVVGAPVLAVVAALRGLERVAHFGIYTPVSNALLSPIPLAQRGQATMLLTSIVRPATAAVSGALLLLGMRYLGPHELAAVIAVLVAVWLAFVLTLRPRYLAALVDNLVSTEPQRRLEAAESLRSMRADEALVPLKQALSQPAPEVRMLAADIARQVRCAPLVPRLREMLAAERGAVKATVIRALEALMGDRAVGGILPRAADAHPDVRRAVCEVCSHHPSAEGDTWLEDALAEETDPAGRTAILGALLHSENPAQRGRAEDRLVQMIDDPDPAARRLATELVGVDCARQPVELLVRCLDDADADVRAAALESLGRLGYLPALPRVLEMAAHDPDSLPARRALRHYGLAAVPVLLRRMGDAAVPPEALHELLRVAGDLGDMRVHDELLARFAKCPDQARLELLSAVNRIRERRRLTKPINPDSLQAVVDQAVRRMQGNQQIIAGLRTCEDRQAVELLIDVYEQRVKRHTELVLEAMRLARGLPDRRLLSDALRLEPGPRRSLALEAVEVALPSEIARAMLAALEGDEGPGQRGPLARGRREEPFDMEDFFRQHLRHGDAWERACAAFAVGRLRTTGLRAELQALTDSEEPLVREAAGEALQRLATDEGVAP